MIVFVTSLAEVDALCDPVVEAAMEDRLAWIAYPKAGQLGTDLNRDILWRHLLKRRIQGVRQIAIDDVWSALRFRREEGTDEIPPLRLGIVAVSARRSGRGLNRFG